MRPAVRSAASPGGTPGAIDLAGGCHPPPRVALGGSVRIESDSTIPGNESALSPVLRLSPFFDHEGVTARTV